MPDQADPRETSKERVVGGRYRLYRRIARGGMADVFLARDQLLDRPVALKVLFPELSSDASFVERFRREAQSAANLTHPNIVNVYDWGQEGATYFIVMEYVEGRTLSQMIADEGPIEPAQAAAIGAEIAAALAFAHKSGVVHRDVKPGNVLISPSGTVKVTDFGIARAVSSSDNLTQTGTVMGTATYFSPEQAQGHPVDPRSDVYSLGVVLYEMAAAAPPFSGESPVAVAYKHVQETPPPLTTKAPRVPVAYAAIVERAMAKNPAARFASADDLRADLRSFRDGHPISPATAAAVGATAANPTTTPARGTGRVDATQAYQSGTQVLPPGSVTAPPKKQQQSRSGVYLGVLVVLLAALAALIFVIARQLGGDDSPARVAIPLTGLIGETTEDATAVLTDLGFEVTVDNVPNDVVDAGIVFDTDPEAGTMADEGSTVTLIVSSGSTPIDVPNVVGMTEQDAGDLLSSLGLAFTVDRVADDARPLGEVLAQDPPEGESLPKGETVTLTVSSGKPEVEVPDVSGRTATEAANVLGQAGFTTTTTDRFSDTVASGQVIGTDPAAGASAESGSSVTIIVSKGPELATVPDVIGEDEADAISMLEDAGFEVAVVDQIDLGNIGKVVDQNPAGTTQAKKGSTVTITVGRPLGDG